MLFIKFKGMLKLLRALGEPRVPEIMFSYSWSAHPESIRTLAHSIWDSGIGVWIDVIKLVSGDTIVEDIQRAAKETNLVQIFLTPEYLTSRNCNIEFLEAVKFPGKLHVHVLKWDSKVVDALRFLVNDAKLAHFRFTAHPLKEKSNLFNSLNLSDPTDQFIAKLQKGSKGWRELISKYHAYITGDGDIWDFGWWIMNAPSGGGIPDNCAIPRTEKVSKRAVKIGNIFLDDNCRRTGKRASAFPWMIILFLLAVVLPLVDVYYYTKSNNVLLSSGKYCSKSLNLSKDWVRQDLCEEFYSSNLFQNEFINENPFNIANYSAFKDTQIVKIFDDVRNRAYCNDFKATPLNDPYEIYTEYPCLQELQNWFSPTYIDPTFLGTVNPPAPAVFSFTYFMTLLYLVAGIFEIREIMNTIRVVPYCLRPLLAVSSIRRQDDEKKKLISRFAKSKNHTPIQTKENFRKNNDDLQVPNVYVAIHGSGLIAQKLREFMTNLNVILPKEYFIDILDPRNDFSGNGNIPNINEKEGLAWVNVFVVSTPEDRERLYQLRKKINFEVSVIIRDMYGGNFMEQNVIQQDHRWNNGSPSINWFFTILFIDTHEVSSSKQAAKGIKAIFRQGLASQVVMNISLRMKDALSMYGYKVKQRFKWSAPTDYLNSRSPTDFLSSPGASDQPRVYPVKVVEQAQMRGYPIRPVNPIQSGSFQAKGYKQPHMQNLAPNQGYQPYGAYQMVYPPQGVDQPNRGVYQPYQQK
ncbi:hypothetical protein HK096_004508 [Nowakowskiella sp. JEL0078]|nr:hypothetical protein HK096_004508 [Nowakowskiella sp. JEL0078]